MATKKPPITRSGTRGDRSKNMGQGNGKNPVSTPKPRTSATGPMTRQGPTAKGTRTSSDRPISPRLPKLPKQTGTTQTIRATGGNSSYPKINRLSAQVAKPTVRSAPRGPQVAPPGVTKAVSSALSLRKLTPIGVAYETLKARPVANGELAYNQRLAAQIIAKKKKKKG